jgi:hypothetical protein
MPYNWEKKQQKSRLSTGQAANHLLYHIPWKGNGLNLIHTNVSNINMTLLRRIICFLTRKRQNAEATTIHRLYYWLVQKATIHSSHIAWRVQSIRHCHNQRTRLASYTAGISDSTLLLLASYLAGVKFKSINGRNTFRVEKNTCRHILGRRPGPIPYNLHAADMPRRPGIEISHFGDHTAAFTSRETQPAYIYIRIYTHTHTCMWSRNKAMQVEI